VIGLYGVSNDAEEQKQLENVGTNQIISQIRTISAGESVGYGRRFVAKPKIATIPMGCRWNSRGWGMGGTCYDQKLKLI
jgi:alanine racemase